jgi:hypothetical protein
MTTVNPSTRSKHTITYIILGAIFLVLIAIALGVYRSAKASVQANQKADQLISALQAKGYHPPPKDQITRVLGEDGGSICADPNNALRRAILNGMLTNGAAGPGQRPIIADSLVVKGQLLVISIYCPEKLADFTEYADNLKYGDVINE